jgi:hypothetical protein
MIARMNVVKSTGRRVVFTLIFVRPQKSPKIRLLMRVNPVMWSLKIRVQMMWRSKLQPQQQPLPPQQLQQLHQVQPLSRPKMKIAKELTNIGILLHPASPIHGEIGFILHC